ncbi:MAG: hypothetical protein ABTR92_19665 [Candidatus Accumulibacter phosphatis]
MTAPYINHLTLSTGHTRRSPRAEVGDDTLAWLVPWLREAVALGTPQPLPVADLARYTLLAMVEDGALLATLYAGIDAPLVTIGVAQRSRQGACLWEKMIAAFDAAPGLERPAEPWCAVALHAGILDDPGAGEWPGDFERCLAWAWITRSPQLGAVR